MTIVCKWSKVTFLTSYFMTQIISETNGQYHCWGFPSCLCNPWPSPSMTSHPDTQLPLGDNLDNWGYCCWRQVSNWNSQFECIETIIHSALIPFFFYKYRCDMRKGRQLLIVVRDWLHDHELFSFINVHPIHKCMDAWRAEIHIMTSDQ